MKMSEARALEAATQVARNLVAYARLQHRPVKTICLFSGGNDSTILFHIVKDLIDHVAHISTGIGIPDTLDFVQQTARDFEVPLLIERTPRKVYEDLVLERGFPGPAMHFKFYCRLKERRLDDMKRRFVGRRGKDKILFLTGLRISESKRRKMHIGKSGPIHPASHSPRMIFCNPIMDFTPEMLYNYRELHDVPRSPVADLLHMSGECLCGAYAHPNELREIEMWFPETAKRIHDLETRVHRAGIMPPHCTWGHGGGKHRGAKVGVLCQSCELRG